MCDILSAYEMKEYSSVFFKQNMIALINLNGEIVKVNNRFLEILHYPRNKFTGMRMDQLYGEWGNIMGSLQYKLKKDDFVSDIINIKDTFQREINVMIHISHYEEADSKNIYYLVMLFPFSNNKAQEKWKRIAYTDELTGLSNYRKFRDCISKRITRNSEFGLLFIDIDHFKQFNDRFGHLNGDEALRKCAYRLNSLGNHVKVFRKSGDEFLVLIDDIQQLSAIKLGIAHKFKEKFRIGHHFVSINISIGTSVYPYCGTDEATLIQAASFSMYRAKQMNNRSRLFGEIINE